MTEIAESGLAQAGSQGRRQQAAPEALGRQTLNRVWGKVIEEGEARADLGHEIVGPDGAEGSVGHRRGR
ncbi:hypothetical protein [Methylobacterium radiotolerans]|uniref:hypothetical protein n=1 Tax=Methylobacterium radiotolerans TaxID=31998 RepID=UPI0038CF7815